MAAVIIFLIAIMVFVVPFYLGVTVFVNTIKNYARKTREEKEKYYTED